jgi:hypothetical protein
MDSLVLMDEWITDESSTAFSVFNSALRDATGPPVHKLFSCTPAPDDGVATEAGLEALPLVRCGPGTEPGTVLWREAAPPDMPLSSSSMGSSRCA